MAQEDLIPVTERTKEEAKEISQAGGIASGIARRKKRDLKAKLAAMWEITTARQKRQFKKQLEEERNKTNPDLAQIDLMEDYLRILEDGGAEALMTMQALTDQRTAPSTKLMGLDMLFSHEHGRPKQKTELTGADGQPLLIPAIKDDISRAK